MTNMDDETITRYAKSILDDKNYRGRLIEQVGDIKLYAAIANAALSPRLPFTARSNSTCSLEKLMSFT